MMEDETIVPTPLSRSQIVGATVAGAVLGSIALTTLQFITFWMFFPQTAPPNGKQWPQALQALPRYALMDALLGACIGLGLLWARHGQPRRASRILLLGSASVVAFTLWGLTSTVNFISHMITTRSTSVSVPGPQFLSWQTRLVLTTLLSRVPFQAAVIMLFFAWRLRHPRRRVQIS